MSVGLGGSRGGVKGGVEEDRRRARGIVGVKGGHKYTIGGLLGKRLNTMNNKVTYL